MRPAPFCAFSWVPDFWFAGEGGWPPCRGSSALLFPPCPADEWGEGGRELGPCLSFSCPLHPCPPLQVRPCVLGAPAPVAPWEPRAGWCPGLPSPRPLPGARRIRRLASRDLRDGVPVQSIWERPRLSARRNENGKFPRAGAENLVSPEGEKPRKFPREKKRAGHRTPLDVLSVSCGRGECPRWPRRTVSRPSWCASLPDVSGIPSPPDRRAGLRRPRTALAAPDACPAAYRPSLRWNRRVLGALATIAPFPPRHLPGAGRPRRPSCPYIPFSPLTG